MICKATREEQQSQAGAHRSDLATAIHVGFAAKDSPYVLHLCEVVDRLAQLKSAHAIHLQAHLDQSALRGLVSQALHPCAAQFLPCERIDHLCSGSHIAVLGCTTTTIVYARQGGRHEKVAG